MLKHVIPQIRLDQIGIIFLILAVSVIIAVTSVNREYFTYGTETDYLGGFTGTADRIMNNKPLKINFHPPLYPFVLAATQYSTSDWFKTGLLVSWLASIIVMVTIYLIFSILDDRSMLWGALIGLITSPCFILYSSLATSDIFFLAIYMATFLLLLLASQKDSILLWGLAGICLGLVVLTRTNAITAMLFLGFPRMVPYSTRKRSKYFISLVSAFLITLSIWAIYANISGSPVWPKKTYVNLALTYFSPIPDRISGEGFSVVEQQYNNLSQVILADPVHIAKVYIKDFLKAALKIFGTNRLLQWPFQILALPGIYLLLKKKHPFIIWFIIATALQFILVNFKAYETRYFLFMIPILGASAGLCIKKIIVHLPYRIQPYLVIIIGLFLIVFGFGHTIHQAKDYIHSQDLEFREVIPQLKHFVGPTSSLVARKPHLGFYMNVPVVGFPNVDNFKILKEKILNRIKKRDKKKVFLYYGSIERRYRPQFKKLLFPQESPPWLIPIAKSKLPNKWTLYKMDFN